MKVIKKFFFKFPYFSGSLRENLHSEISIKNVMPNTLMEKKTTPLTCFLMTIWKQNPRAKTKGKAQVYVKPVYP